MDENSQKYEGFTKGLALTDLVPVLLFGISGAAAAKIFPDRLFKAGVALCTAAGACKVIWKFLLAGTNRDRSWLNRAFRIGMPCGFAAVLAGFAVHRDAAGRLLRQAASGSGGIFFRLCGLGIAAMSVLKVRLDGKSARDNWIEQSVNIFAQSMMFLGIKRMLNEKTD